MNENEFEMMIDFGLGERARKIWEMGKLVGEEKH